MEARNITRAAIIAALATATSLVADTLQIGAFSLPYRFEDTNITDIVRHVVTNDVQSFCTPITGFRPPHQDKNGYICVPPSFARSIGMRQLVYANGYWSLCF